MSITNDDIRLVNNFNQLPNDMKGEILNYLPYSYIKSITNQSKNINYFWKNRLSVLIREKSEILPNNDISKITKNYELASYVIESYNGVFFLNSDITQDFMIHPFLLVDDNPEILDFLYNNCTTILDYYNNTNVSLHTKYKRQLNTIIYILFLSNHIETLKWIRNINFISNFDLLSRSTKRGVIWTDLFSPTDLPSLMVKKLKLETYIWFNQSFKYPDYIDHNIILENATNDIKVYIINTKYFNALPDAIIAKIIINFDTDILDEIIETLKSFAIARSEKIGDYAGILPQELVELGDYDKIKWLLNNNIYRINKNSIESSLSTGNLTIYELGKISNPCIIIDNIDSAPMNILPYLKNNGHKLTNKAMFFAVISLDIEKVEYLISSGYEITKKITNLFFTCHTVDQAYRKYGDNAAKKYMDFLVYLGKIYNIYPDFRNLNNMFGNTYENPNKTVYRSIVRYCDGLNIRPSTEKAINRFNDF